MTIMQTLESKSDHIKSSLQKVWGFNDSRVWMFIFKIPTVFILPVFGCLVFRSMLTLQSLNYQSNVFTNGIKQGSQFDVSLFTMPLSNTFNAISYYCSLPWVCFWHLRSVVMLAQSQEHTHVIQVYMREHQCVLVAKIANNYTSFHLV